MKSPGPSSLRIAVVGGGPAGSFFALYALKYAQQAGRDVSVTIYESKDFRRFGPPGCNMCAGIIPFSVVRQLGDLDLALPPELILSHISTYALHTSAGTLEAPQPDADADIVSVYRGTGPRYGHPPGQLSFDELLLEEAVARGATLRRCAVEAIWRGPPIEVESAGESERYDLVVLATGVNGHLPALHSFKYLLPPTDSMCQAELYLGQDEVQRRLGQSVHIFLPPNDVATYGILIPKGPYVTASLLDARGRVGSLRQFLALDEVRAVLGAQARQVCGCLPKISVGPAEALADDGFVAVGDAGATRLYKNGIGSALATAERAAWTVVYRGCAQADFAAGYLPLCRAIHLDNLLGRLLFLEVPLLKRFAVMPMAHYRLAAAGRQRRGASVTQARILWGMFTGAYSYRQLVRMTLHADLILQLALALVRSCLQGDHQTPTPSRRGWALPLRPDQFGAHMRQSPDAGLHHEDDPGQDRSARGHPAPYVQGDRETVNDSEPQDVGLQG